MKLCVPSQDDRGLDSRTVEHFGRAPWFTIVDTEVGTVDSRPNPSCHTHAGNCHHVGILRGMDVGAVATPGMGRRAWRGLHDAGIEVFTVAASRVGDVVDAVSAGAATRLDEEAACAGHHGEHGHGDHHHHHHHHAHGGSGNDRQETCHRRYKREG